MTDLKESKESESKDESSNSPDSSSKTSKTPLIIRFYIVAHCNPGSEYLYGDDGSKTHYKEVAKRVISILKQINNNSLSLPPGSYIKISIIACSAGSNKKGKPSGSFAENLYKELRLEGVTADVVARVQDVTMRHNSTEFWKETARFDDNRRDMHHQPGSKVLFTLDEKGRPIYKDAYSDTWKSRVLSIIQDRVTKTKKENKRIILNELHKRLKNMPEDVILETLKIYVKEKSFVDEGGFFRKTDTRKAFESLVDEGIRMVYGLHTIATTTVSI